MKAEMGAEQPETIAAIVAAHRAGTMTPAQTVARTYQRIRDHNDPAIFISLRDEKDVLAEAERLARRDAAQLPLFGVPVAVKDNIDVLGMPTTAACPAFSYMPTHDSTAVAKLREAGAIIIGKTTTTEFAASHPWHKTQNPHEPGRTPGGSSSGTCAAVGAGMVPAGLGTQVVGSILRPASFCGAVGFKPSVGAINRSGSHDHFSQSCQGAIGATLADTWAVLRAIADRTGGDPGFVGLTGDVNFSRRAKPSRLGVLETGGWSVTTDGARQAFAAAREKLAKAGVDLTARANDPDLDALEKAIADAQPLTLAINAWEGRWPLNTYVDLDAGKLSPGARERLKVAEATTQKQYGELLGRRVAARAAYARAAERYDAFVTLGACGAAPIGLGTTGNTAMNVAASLLGCPALTLPVLHDEGLPLGLQLLGATDRDAALFDVANYVARDVFERADLVGAAG